MDKYDKAIRRVMKPKTKINKLFDNERRLKAKREEAENPPVPWYLKCTCGGGMFSCSCEYDD